LACFYLVEIGTRDLYAKSQSIQGERAKKYKWGFFCKKQGWELGLRASHRRPNAADFGFSGDFCPSFAKSLEGSKSLDKNYGWALR
jgi:hypothetical protein